MALKTDFTFDLKICLEIRPTIKTKIKCFAKGYQLQTLFILRGVKFETTLSIVVWKKMFKIKATLKRIKPNTGTAKKDKIFLRRLFLLEIFFLLT